MPYSLPFSEPNLALSTLSLGAGVPLSCPPVSPTPATQSQSSAPLLSLALPSPALSPSPIPLAFPLPAPVPTPHSPVSPGEKPYVCTVPGCGKRFTEYSSLYKHHVVHTHCKPYTCSSCGKTYRQTSTLAMHKRSAHGELEATEESEQALYEQQQQLEGEGAESGEVGPTGPLLVSGSR